MRIRGARKDDFEFVDKLYKNHEFKLDLKHLLMMLIAEDEEGIPVAIMSLNTVLECSFLTDNKAPRRERIAALKVLTEQGKIEVKTLGYDGTHAFANEQIAPIMKKHFEFVPAKGENLFLFVE